MRALLLTVGSQGDVRPMVAFADRLRRAGHEAVLAAPALFRPLARASRVPFLPLNLDMTTVAGTVADTRGPRSFVTLARTMGRLATGMLRDDQDGWITGAASDVDVVVHHPVLPLGQHLAERFGVPAVLAPPAPLFVPTETFVAPMWSSAVPFPGSVNRASYRLSTLLFGMWCRRDIERWRRQAPALPRRRGRHDPLRGPSGEAVPVLHSFSRHVLPPPGDWPETAHVTGYWSLPTPADWTPPYKLATFLDSGDPPVYIGFGSMPIKDPGRLAATIGETVRRLGTRAIVASWQPGLRGLLPADQVLVIRHAPHDWLFPQVSAVVQHGGAGTTGAAATAGRPQVICPFGFDQPFWAKRVRDLGVATTAGPLPALTAPRLERALRQVLEDPGFQVRADALGRRIRAEDGTGRALTLLEQIVTGSPTTRVGAFAGDAVQRGTLGQGAVEGARSR